MALSSEEQKLYEFAKGALPSWIRDGDEFLYGAAKAFGSVRAMIDYLFGQALIGGATGATATTPDWLAQHARDRGTSRAAAEDDVTLRARLRNTPDAITRSAILDAIGAVLEANGITAAAAMLELPRDGAYLGTYSAALGTGGAFVQDGTTTRFTPTELPWAAAPWRSPDVFPGRRYRIAISSPDDAGNAGEFDIDGLDGNAVIYTNPTGVTDAVDAGVLWSLERMLDLPRAAQLQIADMDPAAPVVVEPPLYVSATAWDTVFGAVPAGASGNGRTLSIAFDDTGTPGIEVRDGERYALGGGVFAAGWTVVANHVGIRVNYDSGGLPADQPTVADLEAAVDAASLIVNVRTPDTVHATWMLDQSMPDGDGYAGEFSLGSHGTTQDGWSRTYIGRGYRIARTRPAVLIVILPFGTSAGIAASIAELVRTKKAAGIRVIVERRLIA